MTTVEIKAISYSYDTAEAATGISRDVIQRAVRAGDIATSKPEVDGKPTTKPLIPHDDLWAWVERGRKNT
jgi:hypothetical protein